MVDYGHSASTEKNEFGEAIFDDSGETFLERWMKEMEKREGGENVDS